MTLFDYFNLAVLALSGIIGFARGATREITTVMAFLLAAMLAIFGLRLTGPIARAAIHSGWMADAAAVMVVFVGAYIVFRLIGGGLTRGVRATALSGLDRILGGGVGLVRGLIVIGAFTLLISAATSAERMPHWMTGAKTYPLANAAGRGLKALAPKGLKLARDTVPMALNVADGHGDKRPQGPENSTEDTR